MTKAIVVFRNFSNAPKGRNINTVEPRYNDICLYDTLSIAPDILWYQLVPLNYNATLLVYCDTQYSGPSHDVITEFDCTCNKSVKI
jgi:hypothetical protein